MIPLPAIWAAAKALPWRLIGAVALVVAVAWAGFVVSGWREGARRTEKLEAKLEAERACAPRTRCAERVAALEARQAAISEKVVSDYEQELADLRTRPVPRRVIRVCSPRTDGAVRHAPGAGGTAAAPGAGVVQPADEFDTGPLRDLARRADEVSAAYRALRARDEALARPPD